MPLPIKDEINVILKTLPKFIENGNSNIQELLSHDQEDKVADLEKVIGSLKFIQGQFTSDIEELINKVEKEIKKEKKKTNSINVK